MQAKKIPLSKNLRKHFSAIVAEIESKHFANPNASKSAIRSAVLIRSMANLLRQHNHPDASNLNMERTALLQIYAIIFQSTNILQNRHEETKTRMLKLLNQYGVNATDLTFLDQPANGNDTPSIFRQIFDDTCVLLAIGAQKSVKIDDLHISKVITHDPMAKADLNKLLADYGQLVVDLGLLSQTPKLFQNGRDVRVQLAPTKPFKLTGNTYDCISDFVMANGRFPMLKDLFNKNKPCATGLKNFSLFWFQNQLAAQFFLIGVITKDSRLSQWEQAIPEKYRTLYDELKDFLQKTPEAQEYLTAVQALPVRDKLIVFTKQHPQFLQTLNPLLSNVRFNLLARNWNLFFMTEIFERQMCNAAYDPRIKLGALMQAIMPPTTDQKYMCSIQRSPMVNPVYLGDAVTGKFDEIHPFDRDNINRWLETKKSNPFTNEELQSPKLKPIPLIAQEIKDKAEKAKERFLLCNFKFNQNPFKDTVVNELQDHLAFMAWIQIKFNISSIDHQQMLGLINQTIKNDKTRLLLIMSHPALFEAYANQDNYGSKALFIDMHTAGLLTSPENNEANVKPFFEACEAMPWLADCCLSRTRFWPVLRAALNDPAIAQRFIYGDQAKVSVLANIVSNAIHHNNSQLLQTMLQYPSALEALRNAKPDLVSVMDVTLGM